MIGLLFATQIEARPFLEWSQAVQVSAEPFAVYQVPSRPDLWVTISGMGKVAAATACLCQIKDLKVEEIINAGVCGALQNDAIYAPGELFCVSAATEGDHEVPDIPAQLIISDGRFDWDLPLARLITCDKPVFDTQKREALSPTADLVDMEGAAIARTAAMFSVPWTMIKGVTDSAGPTDREVLKHNLTTVSEKISRFLWNHLREI